jgi:hypothetical protein
VLSREIGYDSFPEADGDAAVVHTLADQTTAAAVVDGIGRSERVSSVATLLAEVAARVGAGVSQGVRDVSERGRHEGSDGFGMVRRVQHGVAMIPKGVVCTSGPTKERYRQNSF